MKKFIAYHRISTLRQFQSGLGLQAQKDAVVRHVNEAGQIIAEFTEVETGTRKKKRVEIYKAIELAKKENATLIVGKLDRLARDVEFTSALYNGNVNFICCDNPNANKLTIQLLSVIAEHEAEVISRRIKDALKVKKEKILRGDFINKDGSVMKSVDGKVRLGNPLGFGKNQALGIEKIKANAASSKANIQAMDIVCSSRAKGASYQEIADKLNSLQYQTRRGKKFTAMQGLRLYRRCNQKDAA